MTNDPTKIVGSGENFELNLLIWNYYNLLIMFIHIKLLFTLEKEFDALPKSSLIMFYESHAIFFGNNNHTSLLYRNTWKLNSNFKEFWIFLCEKMY